MKDRVINPPDLAIALQYDGDNAPRVTAKGKGLVAAEIIALAEANDVPLHGDPDLSVLLSQLPLGDEIPDSLYRAVAEVIAFAFMVSGRVPEGFDD
ncbi:MAG TPA: flagellar protein FhlB [Chromatiaceae bacterium]|jgi:flagellar biosynthesis protein|nr:flagellar protein FhlB [Chromatiaceae bacterium]HIN82572.1 flagellar protein FhlB [Chromatiales bacterium]HIA08257.1 flagellar protein FhlB [Chromatiaceae bacterium]HIB85087.1 flagellar protein FhlB [Chromatiaceae bacterium]HIO14450.1 flagellar protein FhlB [Chromatiales bacterium]